MPHFTRLRLRGIFSPVFLVVLSGQSPIPAVAENAGVRSAEPAAVEQGIAIYFSPDGGCAEAIAQHVARARRSIDVQAYILSTSLIGRPLAEAARRGVKVRVIFDKEQADKRFSWDEQLAAAGAEVYYDDPADDGLNHNKIILIDNEIIITGSFNFSRSAEEKNVENLVIMRGKRRLVAAYRKNFDERMAASAGPVR